MDGSHPFARWRHRSPLDRSGLTTDLRLLPFGYWRRAKRRRLADVTAPVHFRRDERRRDAVKTTVAWLHGARAKGTIA